MIIVADRIGVDRHDRVDQLNKDRCAQKPRLVLGAKRRTLSEGGGTKKQVQVYHHVRLETTQPAAAAAGTGCGQCAACMRLARVGSAADAGCEG